MSWLPTLDGYTFVARNIDPDTGIGVIDVTRVQDGTVAEIRSVNLNLSTSMKNDVVGAVFSLIDLGVQSAIPEDADTRPGSPYFTVLRSAVNTA
jgi:hypothetical protein